MQNKYTLSEHTFHLTYSQAPQIHSLALLHTHRSFLIGSGAGKANVFILKYCHLDNYFCVFKTSTQKAQKAVPKTKNEMQSLQIEDIIPMEA